MLFRSSLIFVVGGGCRLGFFEISKGKFFGFFYLCFLSFVEGEIWGEWVEGCGWNLGELRVVVVDAVEHCFFFDFSVRFCCFDILLKS